METAINYTNKDTAFFSSDEKKWINKIMKFKETYPDKVTIIADPDTNDGCVYAKIPAEWLTLRPKVVRELTQEQREAASERMRNARQVKTIRNNESESI